MQIKVPTCIGAFFILAASLALADTGAEIVPDVVYGHKDGMALTFDVIKPQNNPNGAGILWIISGGWVSTWKAPNADKGSYNTILNHGFTIFAVRHGSSPKYNIPEIVGDVRRSVRYIRLHAKEYGVDPERLGVTGGSAGGHLSLILGATADDGDAKNEDPVLRVSDRVAAVVAYYPPTDIRAWVSDPASPYYKNYPALRFDPEKAGEYSPICKVDAGDAPTLLIHGNQDTKVPLDHSQNILAEFKKCGVPCDLLVIPGAAHGFKNHDAELAEDARIKWFEKYLLKN